MELFEKVGRWVSVGGEFETVVGAGNGVIVGQVVAGGSLRILPRVLAAGWTTASFCRSLSGSGHPCWRSPAPLPVAECHSLKAHDGLRDLIVFLAE